MQHYTVYIRALLIINLFTQLLSFSPFVAQLGAVIKSINEQKNLSQVCDESDKTGNWFVIGLIIFWRYWMVELKIHL